MSIYKQSPFLILDGNEPIKESMRAINESDFVVVRLPQKRHLYEITKSRFIKAPTRPLTWETVSIYIHKHLNLSK